MVYAHRVVNVSEQGVESWHKALATDPMRMGVNVYRLASNEMQAGVISNDRDK